MEWISVENRLPENLYRVLGLGNNDVEFAFIGHYNNGCWWIDSIEGSEFEEVMNDVTHWMPFPELPK